MPRTAVQPPPPGWYDDPYEPGRLRFHDGTRWTDQARDRLPGAEAPDEPLPVAPSRPRPTWVRVLAACCGPLAYLFAIVLGFGGSRVLAVPLILGLMTLVAVAAPRVSYRWSAIVLGLIPFSLPYLLARIGWRLADLPYRDWPPRPEEAAGWRALGHPGRPGRVIYLTRERYGAACRSPAAGTMSG